MTQKSRWLQPASVWIGLACAIARASAMEPEIMLFDESQITDADDFVPAASEAVSIVSTAESLCRLAL